MAQATPNACYLTGSQYGLRVAMNSIRTSGLKVFSH
jgi:hypothetical protein